MDYRKGEQFRLKEHIGYFPDKLHDDEQYEQWLDRHHPIFADQVGTVEEVVPVGVAGGGPVDKETVVLIFDHHNLTSTREQMRDPNHEPLHEPEPGKTRRVSFTEEEFNRLFEPAGNQAEEPEAQEDVK